MADETSKIDSNQKHCLMGVTNAATPELRNIKVAAATSRLLVSATVSGITTITVANEATDTTCFPLFTTAATGDLGPKTNAGLTFNSNTGSLGATLMTTRKISLGSAGVATGSIEINGTTSGTVTLQTADVAGTWTMTLPANDGDANQLLKTDGSGNLSWTDPAAGSGATTALDNLASVAINTSLISDTTNTDDLGSSTKLWKDLFVTNIGATATRVTKGWFTDLESTNMPTVGGTAILTSLTAPQFTTIELGHASDTTLSRSAAGVLAVEGVVIPSISSTNTLTNKRVTPRVSSEASSATPTINTDNVDAHSITALAADITSMTTNLSGTPTNFQKLIIRIKDDGTARAIAWGASFEAKGVALPTTTVLSKVLTVGFIYDTVTSKWGCVASAQEA